MAEKLAVVGLGKLGVPMAAVYSSHGYEVVGVDANWRTVNSVLDGLDHIKEPGYAELLREYPFGAIQLEHGRRDGLDDADVYYIIVPTPSQEDGTFTSEYVVDAIRMLSTALKANEKHWTLVICSTVMPGSCDGVIKDAIINDTNKIPGLDCGLVYSPEFIALGSVIKDMQHPDMQLIGCSDPTTGERIADIYRTITPDCPIILLGLREAELTKIAINSYITMKISYANSIGMLADQMPDVDAFKVCEAIGNDSRIGTKYMSPGGPYGGPCFPRDTIAFETLFRSRLGAGLVQATKQINDYQVERAVALIHAYSKFPGNYPCDVGILGMSYKPGTHIDTESFGGNLKARLEQDGLRVEDDSDGDVPYARANAKILVVAIPDRKYSVIEPYEGQIVLDFWDIVNDHPNVLKIGKSP